MAGSNWFPELFASLLGDAVGRFIKLDPRSCDYLSPLAGKIIALHLSPLNWRLYLCPGEDSLEILPSFDGIPDVTLSGTPLAFARMGLDDRASRALFAGEVTIEGDMKTARRFQELFERLDIDWEASLARLTGQSLAQQLAGVLRSTHAWGLDTLESWQMNVCEYLQEESRDLPAGAEADIFYQEVDTLRADFDRLEARILRLESRFADDFAQD
ncbi:MAG: SCP2 sterol-binding domain-containing protein [Methylococcaceae bacterium]|nr:SCP2 sterol-binding domain-containing protein [Methylococcaceae bacterium]